ncbi:hypothetical protein HPB49_008658 [Dermacentor silvarum]|uniref:Uncharacterized protein n=1 Tax=Dermacentor silvarum TaxID=543639 RepID=A0ACB8CK34_DERSI|nr:hypothetical protein HPB49_008658 [Dermacentor silvarum]
MTVQADKEDGFVILFKDAYREKAIRAIEKNFKAVEFNQKKQKAIEIKMLENFNLDSLWKATNKAEVGGLEIFLWKDPQGRMSLSGNSVREEDLADASRALPQAPFAPLAFR